MSIFKTEYEAIPVRRYVELMRSYKAPPQYHIRWFNGLQSLTPAQRKRKEVYKAKELFEKQELARWCEILERRRREYEEECNDSEMRV